MIIRYLDPWGSKETLQSTRRSVSYAHRHCTRDTLLPRGVPWFRVRTNLCTLNPKLGSCYGFFILATIIRRSYYLLQTPIMVT